MSTLTEKSQLVVDIGKRGMTMDIRRLIAMVDGLLGDDYLCGGCEYGEVKGHVEYGSCASCRRVCADKIIEILEQHKESEE